MADFLQTTSPHLDIAPGPLVVGLSLALFLPDLTYRVITRIDLVPDLVFVWVNNGFVMGAAGWGPKVCHPLSSGLMNMTRYRPVNSLCIVMIVIHLIMVYGSRDLGRNEIHDLPPHNLALSLY